MEGRAGQRVYCLFFSFQSILCSILGVLKGGFKKFHGKTGMGANSRIGVVGAELRGQRWSKILSLAGAHV